MDRHMGYNSVAPYVGATKAQVKIITAVSSIGTARNLISLSSAVMQHLGEPDEIDVFVGDGDDAGTLLIQPGGGHDVVINKRSGNGHFTVPLLPGAPKTSSKPKGCRFELGEGEDRTKIVTVTLPW